ncbi:MAG: SRPBCC domain-containing protein [Sphaerobacter sp.]|nr:SRPBCC domain-containing protein [Sphaerobacter sp.]
MAAERRVVGQTAQSGFQVGVRRTLPFAAEAVWAVLCSPAGMTVWLGGPVALEPGTRYTLADGTFGEVRVYRPGSHIRLTWQPPGWAQPSTLQVRVLPARTGTTLSFHQERMRGPAERAAMKAHWVQVIARLAELLRAQTG